MIIQLIQVCDVCSLTIGLPLRKKTHLSYVSSLLHCFIIRKTLQIYVLEQAAVVLLMSFTFPNEPQLHPEQTTSIQDRVSVKKRQSVEISAERIEATQRVSFVGGVRVYARVR